MSLLLVPLLFALPQANVEPRFVQARVEPHAVAGALDQEFRTLTASRAEPFWIAWAAPRAARSGDSCDEITASPGRTVMLEGSRQAVILFRIERRQVTRIRAYAIDCEMDAGDLAVVWLTGVLPSESVRLLDTFATPASDARDDLRLAPSAIYAIGAHAEPAALELLISKARTEKRATLKRAAFHAIGRRREPRAFAFLEEILQR